MVTLKVGVACGERSGDDLFVVVVSNQWPVTRQQQQQQHQCSGDPWQLVRDKKLVWPGKIPMRDQI